MDPEQGRIASQDAFTGTIIVEAAEIASQVEIIQSEPIAKAVINKLNLAEDPEIQDNASWRSIVKDWLQSMIGEAAAPAAPGQEASDEEILHAQDDGVVPVAGLRRPGRAILYPRNRLQIYRPAKGGSRRERPCASIYGFGLSPRAPQQRKAGRTGWKPG